MPRGSDIEVLLLRGGRERSTGRAVVGTSSPVGVIIGIRHGRCGGGCEAGFVNHHGMTRRRAAGRRSGHGGEGRGSREGRGNVGCNVTEVREVL